MISFFLQIKLYEFIPTQEIVELFLFFYYYMHCILIEVG